MASGERLPVGYRLGDFEITGEIAGGYRARDRDLGREVMIQPLPEGASIRGVQPGARALTSLDHPSIASVYDVVVARERAYLVAELVEGETLEEALSSRELSVDEVVSIARQLASALATAHDQGVVHGGVSPRSVIVGADGSVKLVGFGLASASSAGDDVRSLARLLTELAGADPLPDALERVLEGLRARKGGAREPWSFPRVARWVFFVLAILLVVTAYLTLRRELPL